MSDRSAVVIVGLAFVYFCAAMAADIYRARRWDDHPRDRIHRNGGEQKYQRDEDATGAQGRGAK